jgi:uncharacterized protein (TIGR03083 family)
MPVMLLAARWRPGDPGRAPARLQDVVLRIPAPTPFCTRSGWPARAHHGQSEPSQECQSCSKRFARSAVGQTSFVMTRSDTSVTLSSLFRLERARLLEVLKALEPSDWSRPTRCPEWTVHGLSLHLLGDDLSFLSSQRDEHHGTPAPASLDEVGFINWLDAVQIQWVDAARRLSPRLVVEMLQGLDAPVADTIGAHDPSVADGHVSWASEHPVPRWLDQTRELSERWIHRQQILEAVGRPVDLNEDLARPVLDGLRWAFPFRLGDVLRPPGTTVTVTVTGPEVATAWTLVSDGTQWQFSTGSDSGTIAAIEATTDQTWRLLTNNLDPTQHGMPTTIGDKEITDVLLRTRAIIGIPK